MECDAPYFAVDGVARAVVIDNHAVSAQIVGLSQLEAGPFQGIFEHRDTDALGIAPEGGLLVGLRVDDSPCACPFASADAEHEGVFSQVGDFAGLDGYEFVGLRDISDRAGSREVESLFGGAGGEDSDGLPIGMQLIGRQYCEETLLSLAEIYEKGAAK